MSIQRFAVSFSTDSEQFISRACCECRTRFKSKISNGEATIAFCPFCRREGSRWETPEQLEYGKALAAKSVLQPELMKLDRAFKSLQRAGGSGLSVKVTGRMPDLRVPRKPIERTEEMPNRTVFECCGTVVRHAATTHPSACPACGNPLSGDGTAS